MKKYFQFVSLCILFGPCAIAQKSNIAQHAKYIPASVYRATPKCGLGPLMRRAIDTGYYWNNATAQIDTTGSYLIDQVMPADSGYWFGMNALNFKGFAELYDVNSVVTDTGVKILGVISAWHGHVQDASSNFITFTIWDQDPTQYQIGDTIYVKGLPGSRMYSQDWPVAQLQIGRHGDADTIPVITMFSTPVANISSNFFAGYELRPYTSSGDTITLGATPQGTGVKVGLHYSDPVNGGQIYVPRNAIEVSDGLWQDCFYNYGFDVNFAIVPIVEFDNTLGVNSISKNGLSFFGNYPNPAINETNIKFALNEEADVTVHVMDLKGQMMGSITQLKQTEGVHIISLPTRQMPAGDYVYIISTSHGDAMAGKLTVVK